VPGYTFFNLYPDTGINAKVVQDGLRNSGDMFVITAADIYPVAMADVHHRSKTRYTYADTAETSSAAAIQVQETQVQPGGRGNPHCFCSNFIVLCRLHKHGIIHMDVQDEQDKLFNEGTEMK